MPWRIFFLYETQELDMKKTLFLLHFQFHNRFATGNMKIRPKKFVPTKKNLIIMVKKDGVCDLKF